MKSIFELFRRRKRYVYLSEDILHPGVLFRFRVKRNRVALVWNTLIDIIPFVCRLGENGDIIIDEKYLAGYGKPYGGWKWRNDIPADFPKDKVLDGGYWS